MQVHGFVWVKSGYRETIAWRKVQLTEQRNVGLTTDGLWAMPLNKGWVPVKARRLQDWEKLKKYVSIHKQGVRIPPQTGQNFGALDQKFIKPAKSAKTHRAGAL